MKFGVENTLTGRLSTMTNALHAVLRLIPQDLLSTERLEPETSAKTYARARQVPAHRHKAAQSRQDSCIGGIGRCRAAVLCAYRASIPTADHGRSSVTCPWSGNTDFDAIPSTMIHLRS